MKTAKRLALGFGFSAILAGLVGCGGDAGFKNASAPTAPAAYGAPEPMAANQSVDSAPPAPPPQSAPQGGRSSGPAAEARGSRSLDAPREPAKAEAPTSRPGLATQWGETRNSRISTVSFQRAETTTPFAMLGLFYNDEEGARAMANTAGFRRTAGGPINAAGGAVTVGLRDERGAFLNGYVSGGKSFIVGEAGQRYAIVLRNNTDLRFEIVLSVDGLDVLDGKAAGFNKRGYIIDPRGEVEVDGFRQSMDTVAAFRFGSVRSSYAAQKTGDTRNVGVIGVALFHERGTNPFPWTNGEIQKRNQANPFPGQFATPP